MCVCVFAGDAFPWTVCVSQLSVYSLLGQQRSLSVLEPLGCTSTLALTAPKLQPESKDAFIMCLHVDLQPVHLKCSNPQVLPRFPSIYAGTRANVGRRLILSV